MKSDSLKKIILYLIVAFVVISIWKDPQGSASTAGTFFTSVGHFFQTFGRKMATFLKNL